MVATQRACVNSSGWSASQGSAASASIASSVSAYQASSCPSFLLHGNRLLPGLSRRKSGTIMISIRRGSWTIIADLIPNGTTSIPRIAPPKIIPPLLEANIRPFTVATSSGLRTSTARASTLTSCRDANRLWMNRSMVTNWIEATRSGTNSRAARDMIMPVSANRTQGRRTPYWGNVTISMTGPQMNLNVQGR